MELRAKRGRNQKGICYAAASRNDLVSRVYCIRSGSCEWLADIRRHDRVSHNEIVLDSRIFDALDLEEGTTIEIHSTDHAVPSASEIMFDFNSVAGLDNGKVAEVISKRVNDLRDDFDGLILRRGSTVRVERLQLEFTVIDMKPGSPSRISWSKLGGIRLIPRVESGAFNLICVVEVGGAAHIQDSCEDADCRPTALEAYLKTIDSFGQGLQSIDALALFAGFAFSDDVLAFRTFDSETGEPCEITSLQSSAVIQAYKSWIESIAAHHSRRSSDLGDAVSDAIQTAKKIGDANELPTAVVLFSGGVFSSGPNPVKSIKRAHGLPRIGFFIVHSGHDVEMDILEAMAAEVGGKLLKAEVSSDVQNVLDSIQAWAVSEVIH